jgi:3-dehydroquinate synthetase
MKTKQVPVKLQNNPHEYQIEIKYGSLETCGVWARECLSPKTKKVALVSNMKVFRLYGETVKNSLENEGFEVFVF